MRRIGSCGLFLLSCLLPASGVITTAAAQTGKIVFLVRHAEKSTEPESDPALTNEGHQRAEALASALKDARIDHVITTQLRRTVETAAVLARKRSIEPQIVAVRGGVGEHVRAVADAIRARPDGEAILVVGHSNTIPAIVGELGGSNLADLEDDEYATIFVLMLVPGAEPRTARLTFGSMTGTG